MAFLSGLHGVLGVCFLFCRAHRPVLQRQIHAHAFSTLLGTSNCMQISRGGGCSGLQDHRVKETGCCLGAVLSYQFCREVLCLTVGNQASRHLTYEYLKP